jgi:hypothetical protein
MSPQSCATADDVEVIKNKRGCFKLLTPGVSTLQSRAVENVAETEKSGG